MVADLELSEVEPLEKLKEGEYKVLFKVRYRDRLCVLKVYHGQTPSEHSSPGMEVNMFIAESAAYSRLKSKGLCERGAIPDFYGTFRDIQPIDFTFLEMFHDDELPANAILLEYIPNLQQIDLSTYTPHRLTKVRQILADMHQANVYHGDSWPRNMAVSVVDGQERVVWIDFDQAQTLPETGERTEVQQRWFRDEVALVEEFIEEFTLDYQDGKLSRAWGWYFE
ncbi:hypothetical protein BJY04DRAFT_218911 [Aspergillus karnatakaensis]|uniref:uncharacterized protein n=1 Tax=Aspergillus karnatakaensis TaxID=1810916 RepID=UPI003CCDF50A